jgi:P27 family predicted phage terminase small subunit
VYLQAATEVPEPPDGLGEAGERLWRALWTDARHWLTPNLDGLMVEMACRDVDEIERYRQHIGEHGWMLAEPLFTAAGKVVGQRQYPNPAVRMLRDCENQLERWLMLLGIPPVARARLRVAEVATVTVLDSLIERRRRCDQGPEG